MARTPGGRDRRLLSATLRTRIQPRRRPEPPLQNCPALRADKLKQGNLAAESQGLHDLTLSNSGDGSRRLPPFCCPLRGVVNEWAGLIIPVLRRAVDESIFWLPRSTLATQSRKLRLLSTSRSEARERRPKAGALKMAFTRRTMGRKSGGKILMWSKPTPGTPQDDPPTGRPPAAPLRRRSAGRRDGRFSGR